MELPFLLLNPPPRPSKKSIYTYFYSSYLPLINKITISEERKEKCKGDNVLDLVWDNHCDANSHIKRYEITCHKLYQAEKVFPN